jgi:predicted RNase H-like HicB family nuclease
VGSSRRRSTEGSKLKDVLVKIKESGSKVGTANVVAECYRRGISFKDALKEVEEALDSGVLSQDDLKESLLHQLSRK